MKLTPEQRAALETADALSEDRGVLITAPDSVLDELEVLCMAKRCSRIPGSSWLTGRGLWPIWAIEHFPSNPEEARAWLPLTFHHALHMNVLCVATTCVEGTWRAYCAPVPGRRHSDEEEPVLQYGEKLSQDVARALFPHLEGIPYAR